MSYTLDMAKFNCVVAGRRLKNISEFQRSDDGEKGTTSDPDIYGNVVVTDKANKMAEFEVTVLNRSDDHDLLEKYYQERRNFTFSYIDNRKGASAPHECYAADTTQTLRPHLPLQCLRNLLS